MLVRINDPQTFVIVLRTAEFSADSLGFVDVLVSSPTLPVHRPDCPTH